jgi:hypothetical protein
MFDSQGEYEREVWFRAKARGKSRFILKRGILPTFVIGLVVLAVVERFGDRRSPFSLDSAVIDLIMLPVFLIGGYLEGKWKWKDLQKKYRE